MKKQLALSSLGVALLCLVVQSSYARLPHDYLRVNARFSPNPAVAGETVTFYWNSSGIECFINGVPNLISTESSGNFSFTASDNLSARVLCEDQSSRGSATARLTVNQAAPLPTVRASYSPNTISSGQSTTLSWNSQYASSCSSTGSHSISSTSGSISVTADSDEYTTVTCTNASGSASATASLTVSPAQPSPPTITYFYAHPSHLRSASTTTLHWGSTNANYCTYGDAIGTDIVRVDSTSTIWNTCYGAGGTVSATTTIYVGLFSEELAAGSKDRAKKEVVDLSHLGLDLQRAGMQTSSHDFNQDGTPDLLVVDTLEREAYLILGNQKAYPQITKTLKNVGGLHEIKQVFVPANKADEIRITTEQ